MYSRENVKDIVYNAIKTVTGIQNITDDMCLLDKEVGCFSADFLYIFDIIEREINKQISRMLVENTYEIFIIENLVEAIYRIYITDTN